MDDATVIKKCRNGEVDVFRHLVERYQRQATAHAAAILLDREDALDAVQEAFIDAFRSIKAFDETRPFYPWFYVLLRNRCYKIAGRRREMENVDDIEILEDRQGLAADERLALEWALHSMPREDREIITMKYLDGLSYDELAEYLQIPKGTVMSRLFYARKSLQAILTGGEDRGGDK